MTKSNTSSETSRKHTRISVKPCCLTKTTKSTSSSSSESSFDISAPIQDYFNLTTPTPCNTNITTFQDLLNLATPPFSPEHGNENIHTSQPSDSTSPFQQTQPPSPRSPMERFQTPPTSPLPYLETLENFSPNESNPPSLSRFDTLTQDGIPHLPRLKPKESLEDGPHHPSLIEGLAYRYARPSIFPQDQGHSYPQSFVFHPVYKFIHDPIDEEPSLRHYTQQQQPPQESFLNLESTSIGNQNTSQPSTLAPSSTSAPPPTNEIPFPPPRHDCGHCERTAHITERCRTEIRELTYEMRFILNHILDRLETLCQPPQV